ncbi:FUN14 domain-containing protein 1-like isoform X2 [Ctenocephalides felis]|uniref:FUN14 domain-containing protein 1-like isoform X2 n=1 Tax=Ctenocephalides felis TaxID=7515 RepID=UPI000E6E5105|nr:FUN14 domain-containing protein 1-like isoform X2 [Ctenocephalides felis]
MASPVVRKSNKDEVNKEIVSMDEVAKDAKNFIERILGDVSKTSATKQLVIGSLSGWTTGFVTMRIGKLAALAVGGGILILQVANHKGYISIDWDKVTKKADKVTDKIEEAVTGETPKLMDKVRIFTRENPYIVTSFIGGFFIGLSC